MKSSQGFKNGLVIALISLIGLIVALGLLVNWKAVLICVLILVGLFFVLGVVSYFSFRNNPMFKGLFQQIKQKKK